MKKLILLLVFMCGHANAEVVTFQCNYLQNADEEGLHQVQQEFKLTFVVNTESAKTFMLGNSGATPVTPVTNDHGGISFIEKTDTGNVMVTTITDSGKSVHSRNSVVFGDLVPSQYYGQCKKQ